MKSHIHTVSQGFWQDAMVRFRIIGQKSHPIANLREIAHPKKLHNMTKILMVIETVADKIIWGDCQKITHKNFATIDFVVNWTTWRNIRTRWSLVLVSIPTWLWMNINEMICYISGKAVGEIWNWSLLGVNHGLTNGVDEWGWVKWTQRWRLRENPLFWATFVAPSVPGKDCYPIE